MEARVMSKQRVPKTINDFISDNVQALANLFPAAVKDGQVDFTALKEELGQFEEVDKEKYELTWAGKQEAKKKAQEDVFGRTLKYIHEDSKNPETTENLYIEGDNLEVLKLLRQNYYGSIKMIYIDPPYNTGNDFVYNDNFKMDAKESDIAEGTLDEYGERLQKNQKSTNRFHANWLNMMYPRLKVAKDLLTDDGAIFISIDDDEVKNLKSLCDEIFGEENFAVQFIWTKTSTPPSLSYKCRKTAEYILVYEKISNNSKYFGELLDNGDAPLLNTGNPIKTLTFPKGSIKFTYVKNGNVKAGDYAKTKILNNINIANGENSNEIKISGEFKWEQTTLDREIENGTYFLIKSDKMSIRFQRLRNDNNYKTPNNFIDIRLNKQSGVGTNESAVKELNQLEMDKLFNFPKPTSLIKKLLLMKSYNDKDSITLDFFSGSGTTADAVMKLNANDGGNRKYILVQLPEEIDNSEKKSDIAYENISEIGKERIRRAGEKIKSEIEEHNKQLKIGEEPKQVPDIGFKVFRTAYTNIKWNLIESEGQIDNKALTNRPDSVDFTYGAKDIDVVYEIMLRQKDIPLSEKMEVLSGIGERTYLYGSAYLICLETEITEELIDQLAALKPLPIKFVFRDSAFKDDINLKDDTFRRLKNLIDRNSGAKKNTYTVEFI